jgi:type IV secretion system protein VirB10
MTNEQTPIPNITDKRVAPPGILPRNIQAWMLGGVALLMAIVIAFSGRLSSKPRAAATLLGNTPVLQPSEDKLEEIKRRIQEQAQKAAIEQAQLTQTKKALTAQMSQPGPGSYSYSLPAASYEPTPGSRMKTRIEEEKEQMEYKSLFASNMVLSYRPQPKQSAGEPTVVPIPPQLDPRLYAWPQMAASPQSMLNAVQATDSESGTRASPTLGKGPNTQESHLDKASGKLYRLFAGSLIETVLTNRLDGTFSGPANCMASYDVYSHDHNHVLIPSGSRVLGEVHPVESGGQSRLAVSFHRLIMPDGYSVTLDQFHGLDQVGETGLRDKVNHHYLQIFGASVAIGLIAGLAQTNAQYGVQMSPVDAYQQGVSNSLAQSSMHILDRFLNILPRFTIREGQRIKIYLAEDLMLPAYENHDMKPDL